MDFLLSAIPYSACLSILLRRYCHDLVRVTAGVCTSCEGSLFELRCIESRVNIDCFGKFRRATLHGKVRHSRTSFEPQRTYIRTSCLKLSFEAAVIRDNDLIPAA